MANAEDKELERRPGEDTMAAVEASEIIATLQEALYDGVLGFALSLGNAITLFTGAAVCPIDSNPWGVSVSAAFAVAAVAVLLLGTCRFSDQLQKKTTNKGVVAAFAISTVASFVCNVVGVYVGGIAFASIALVTTMVMYSGFLTVLPHNALMVVVDVAFVYMGIMLLVLMPAKNYMIPVQGVAILISLVFTASFQTRYVDRHRTISAEDSKKNNIKVRGNASTLLLVGFMLGITACIFVIAQDALAAMVTIGGAVFASGLVSLLLRAAEEKSYKEAMKKTMAVCSCLLLLVPALPYYGKLLCMGLFLFFVCLNMNIIINAIVESARFNVISPVWLVGQQGAIFACGGLAGLALFYVGELAFPHWGMARQLVLVTAVIICCCLQIKVNYQAYPFEPVIEDGGEEPDPAVESAGRRKALWQSKIDATCTLYKLSPRETEVLHILLRGRDVKYIMDKFCISQSTAKTHVYNIYRKLGIHSRQELIDFVEEIEIPAELDE